MKISRFVQKYIENSKLTLRGFAEALSEKIENDLSHATIINWRDGKSVPETDLLIDIAAAYTDWRLDFALDLLNEKHPAFRIEVGDRDGSA